MKGRVLVCVDTFRAMPATNLGTLLLLSAMSNTNSPPFSLDLIVTSHKAALFLLHLCAMRFTNSSLLGIVGTSLEAARLYFRTMCDTNSSLDGPIGTSLEAASLYFRAMCDTNSSLNDNVVTSLEIASLHLRAMRDTHSSLNNLVGTPLVAAPLLV